MVVCCGACNGLGYEDLGGGDVETCTCCDGSGEIPFNGHDPQDTFLKGEPIKYNGHAGEPLVASLHRTSGSLQYLRIADKDDRILAMPPITTFDAISFFNSLHLESTVKPS